MQKASNHTFTMVPLVIGGDEITYVADYPNDYPSSPEAVDSVIEILSALSTRAWLEYKIASDPNFLKEGRAVGYWKSIFEYQCQKVAQGYKGVRGHALVVIDDTRLYLEQYPDTRISEYNDRERERCIISGLAIPRELLRSRDNRGTGRISKEAAKKKAKNAKLARRMNRK